jgi:anaerobic selenocysteine-containing dehydrogenase
MRGLAAHSNGFQTIRTLAILMSLLGTIDRPGGFRHKAPYPRAVPPNARPPKGPEASSPTRRWTARRWAGPRARTTCSSTRRRAGAHRQGLQLGAPAVGPRADAQRHHQRLARRPLPDRHAADLHGQHGLELDDEHVRGPQMLNDKGRDGQYKIPFLVVCDAFQSEMTAFADLILPDTTYLERHDCMSMLDRPISEFDGPVDSVRIPVLPPTGPVQALPGGAGRTGLAAEVPGLHHADGGRKFRDYPDFIVNYETAPGSGIGFLAGWRGKGGEKSHARRAQPQAVGDVRRRTTASSTRDAAGAPVHAQLERRLHALGAGRGPAARPRPHRHPPLLGVPAALPPGGAGQAQGQAAARRLRQRVQTYFDPLPFWYAPLEEQATDTSATRSTR